MVFGLRYRKGKIVPMASRLEHPHIKHESAFGVYACVVSPEWAWALVVTTCQREGVRSPPASPTLAAHIATARRGRYSAHRFEAELAARPDHPGTRRGISRLGMSFGSRRAEQEKNHASFVGMIARSPDVKISAKIASNHGVILR
jgi:hypothetical protein